jgi:hypothetical protein
MIHHLRPRIISGSSVTTYFAEGRSCDLSVSFPLFELCGQDIVPEKSEKVVFLHRLRESCARAE